MARSTSDHVCFLEAEDLKGQSACLSSGEERFLEEVNQKVAGGASLATMMDFLFEMSRKVYPCDRLALAFLSDDGMRLSSYWIRADYSPVLLGTGYSQALQGSSLEGLLESGQIRLIHDFEGYLKEKPSSQSTRLLVQEGVLSSMTLPLVVEGRRVGFLFRSARKRHCYGPRQALLHQRIAERLSQAVEKAWRIERLEKLQESYNEVLRFVSHELKSPLASIIMDGQLLEEGYLGALSEDQKRKVGNMVFKAEHLIGFVKNYLNFARIESGAWTLKRRSVDFQATILQPALTLIAPQRESKGIALNLNAPKTLPPIECDPDLMLIVLVNLLGNGVKYGKKNGRLRVRVEERKDGLQLSVWNSGPGFPTAERHRLFQKFSRLRSPALARLPGTGIGLYTSWQIVQHHRGKLEATSQEGQWAEFCLSIPWQSKTDAPV